MLWYLFNINSYNDHYLGLNIFSFTLNCNDFIKIFNQLPIYGGHFIIQYSDVNLYIY